MKANSSMVANRTLLGRIVELVARQYELPADHIFRRGPNTQAVREARHVCYWLANELRPCLRISVSELASYLGRHHTTALHGIRVATERRSADPWLKATTDRLLKDLKAVSLTG